MAPSSQTTDTGSGAPRPRSFVSWCAARDWQILGAILALAIVLRIVFLAEIVSAPDFRAPQQDPEVQDYYARALVTGDWTLRPGETDPEMRTTPYFRPPGHGYYLYVIYLLTNCSYLAPRLVNMFFGLSAIVLMFLLGRAVFGRVVGLLTAFLMAIYWVLIYWEGELNDPILFVFLVPLLMNVLRLWSIKMTFSRAACAGLIFGCYAIMRPNILAFGPVVALWMLWVAYRQKQVQIVPVSWCGLALATFLVVLPVTVRNYVASGELVPISTYFGENLYIGNCEYTDGITPWNPYLQQLEGTGSWSARDYINVVRGVGKDRQTGYYTHRGLGIL